MWVRVRASTHKLTFGIDMNRAQIYDATYWRVLALVVRAVRYKARNNLNDVTFVVPEFLLCFFQRSSLFANVRPLSGMRELDPARLTSELWTLKLERVWSKRSVPIDAGPHGNHTFGAPAELVEAQHCCAVGRRLDENLVVRTARYMVRKYE